MGIKGKCQNKGNSNVDGNMPYSIPGDLKKLHELDRLYLLDSKRYEDKQGVSM